MTLATTNPPPKPEPPKDYDCCGGGCADCELRLYLKALATWQREYGKPAATGTG